MEPRLLELTNIMQLEKENLSDYTKLIFNACKEYGLAFFHLSFEEVYRKGYISTIFFRNFHDSCLSSFNCSITSTISLFETLPSSKEYAIYLHILAFGTFGLLLWYFHYIYTYSLEHRPKSFYLPLLTILIYGNVITYGFLFDPYLTVPTDNTIYKLLFLSFFYLLLALIYTYEPKPLRRK